MNLKEEIIVLKTKMDFLVVAYKAGLVINTASLIGILVALFHNL